MRTVIPIPKINLFFLIFFFAFFCSVYAQDTLPSDFKDIPKQKQIKVKLKYEKNCEDNLLSECSKAAYEEAIRAAVKKGTDKFADDFLSKDNPLKLKLTKDKIRPYLTGTIVGEPAFSDDDWEADSFKLEIRAVVEVRMSDDLIQEVCKITEPEGHDTIPPTGEITKIRDSYIQGDTIAYTIRADDNSALKKMTFMVKDSSVKRTWDINGKSVTHNASFSTKNWKLGSYAYSLLIEDGAGNLKACNGNFTLVRNVKGTLQGTLNIHCDPPARIFIDGTDTGKTTPAEGIKLTCGKYQIKLVASGNPEYRTREAEVDIKMNQTTQLIVIGNKTVQIND
ncbi:PEGA domain-containing protein [Desulfonema magnum]|uniref:PEGA domain-containing protein n=1 Tax=Desulfonema magnum TaxID=45655 RepID=A0A975BJJ4_9BACT|nr:PEGA domain-containing protein [Desulfonema magnum]QTA86508.1 PEGA domain-containing protein [Desulfonema magnum]